MVAAAMAASLAVVSAARADFYQSKQTGNWSAAGSWEVWNGSGWQNATDPPMRGDNASILNAHVITVACTSESISALTVNPGGRLDIDGCSSGGRAVLTFAAAGAETALVINQFDGVRLLDKYAELRFEASTPITGSGNLIGMHSDAAITLNAVDADTVELSSFIPIYGALVIRGSGNGSSYFRNHGVVQANIAGSAITLDSSLTGISDSPGSCFVPRWSVSASHALLRFGRGAPALTGDFLVGPGRLEVKQSVSTSGRLLLRSGGVILPNLLPPACFTFSGHCPGSHCFAILSPICTIAICP